MREIKLTIGKEEMGFSFGLAFLGELLEETNMSIEEVGTKITRNPFRTVPLIMYYSAKQYAERTVKDFNYTLLDFVDLIDENGGVASKEAITFLEAFTGSLNKGVPKEKATRKKNGTKLETVKKK
jgi:hypothetical protein